VAHYVITVDGPPEGNVERRLLVTSDDGLNRGVTIRLGGQSADSLGDSDAVWRAAIYYSVRELEFAARGEGWGAPVEGGPDFEVTASADELARFIGSPSASVALNDGAVVGEFGA
jgi:hypothetical protein